MNDLYGWSAFFSERQATEMKIRHIPSIHQRRKKRVAAYCRVSTDMKSQAVLDARKRDRISGVYKKTPATHFLYGKVFCARCGAPYKRRTLSGGTADGAPVYHKVWNCRERQKGKAGNGCRNTSVAEEELLRGISDALGWEWKGAEEFDTEQFLREVQAVHFENGAVSVQKWTQRVSA